jgi:hypothetical protein
MPLVAALILGAALLAFALPAGYRRLWTALALVVLAGTLFLIPTAYAGSFTDWPMLGAAFVAALSGLAMAGTVLAMARLGIKVLGQVPAAVVAGLAGYMLAHTILILLWPAAYAI